MSDAGLRVARYDAAMASEWNAFAATARNGVFMHDRRYMDYHADRFEDFSLVIREGDSPVALLPAHRRGDCLVSHGGLSFGGLICGETMTVARTTAALAAIAAACRDAGIAAIDYRPVPRQFHRAPAEEDLFALHEAGAKILRRQLFSVVDLAFPIRMRKGRRHAAAKAEKAGLTVSESGDWGGFWAVLESTLAARHEARPVHSLAEVTMLAEHFPRNIRLFVVSLDGAICGGTVIYESPTVARTQYIAASPLGLQSGALDLLFRELLAKVFGGKRYFDFGASLDGHGGLNAGLLEQKEGFGARAMVQDTYELRL